MPSNFRLTKTPSAKFVEVCPGNKTVLMGDDGDNKGLFMFIAAAFLETHRYAAALGGTMEFTKMEGVALNRKDKVAHVAMSRIEKSMTDTGGDIQVGKITAGATYEFKLAAGQTDRAGNAIGTDWVPAGAEATGLEMVDNLNGFSCLMGNFQHPGDRGSIHSIITAGVDPLINVNWNNKKSAAVGYLSGLPTR